MPTFAAVDIGSNSVRLKISRLAAHRLVEIHEDREVTRLGESVFRSGFLSPEAIALTVKVLRRFHRAAQRTGADVVRVVATSALRDARNSRAFLEWVRSATGWTLEIISGLEEARLIHLGLTSTLRVNSSPVLMMDLGGGSCELTVSRKGHIEQTVSLPLGAVRLTNDFLHHDPPRKSEMRQLRSLIVREVGRIAPRVIHARPKVVIATSGTAEALATVCHTLYRTKSQRAMTVTHLQMRKIAKMLTRLTVEDRRKIHGIGLRRAEIIIAGAAVFAELLDRCKLAGFRFSPWDCAMVCSRKWPPTMTMPRAPAGKSNRSGRIPFLRPWTITAWTSITPPECAIRRQSCLPTCAGFIACPTTTRNGSQRRPCFAKSATT